MVKKHVLLYCFSGTGNTWSLAVRLQKTLERKGHEVLLEAMEKAEPDPLTADTTLGLAFPVAVQSTFPLVWDFVGKLPDTVDTDVFMLDSMESFSGGIVGPLKRVLTKKGYRCIGAREFRMSSSLQTDPGKKERGHEKDRVALQAVESYAEDLDEGRTRWTRVPVLSDWFRSFAKPRSVWTRMSRNLTIEDSCIRCGTCIANCPTSSLSLVSDRVVMNHETCIVCMRCISHCPKSAILYKGKVLQT